MQDQIRRNAAGGPRMHHAVAAEAVGEEEAGHSGRGTDEGVVIRRDGVESRPGGADSPADPRRAARGRRRA